MLQLVIAVALLLALTACGTDDNNNTLQVGSGKSTGGIALPLAIQASTLAPENFRGFISIDGNSCNCSAAQCQPMAIDLENKRVHVVIPNLQPGSTYTFMVEFCYQTDNADYQYPDNLVPLSTAASEPVTLNKGNNTLGFDNTPYNMLDDDNDELNNLKELELGTNPTKLNPKPKIAPLPTDSLFRIDENSLQITTISAESEDPAGTSLTYSIAGGDDQAHVTIDSETGKLDFNSAPNFEKPLDADKNNVYTLVIRATNGIRNDDQAVEVHITNINEPPVIGNPNTIVVVENTIEAIQMLVSDPEGDPINLSIIGGSDQDRFVIDNSSAQLAFIEAPDFDNPQDADADNIYVIQLTADDGVNEPVHQTLTVTVTDRNEAPEFTNQAEFNLQENTQVITTLTAIDPENVAVAYSIVGGDDMALFSIDSSTGELIFLTASDFETPQDTGSDNIYVVHITADDGVNEPITQIITVTVEDNNEAPQFTNQAEFNPQENTLAIATLTAVDPENAAVTYSLIGGEDIALFSIDSASGQLVFITAPDFEHPQDADSDNIYLVQVQASDGQNSLVQVVTVTVIDIDDSPQFTNPTEFNTPENTLAIATLTAIDPEDDAITYSLSGGEDIALFSIGSSNGQLVFLNAPDFENPQDTDSDNIHLVQVQASDGTNNTKLTIKVEVTNINEAPKITSPAEFNLPENTLAITTITAIDSENNSITYSLSGGEDIAFFSIDSSNGQLVFLNTPDFENPADTDKNNIYLLQVSASDGDNPSTQDLTIAVVDATIHAPQLQVNADAKQLHFSWNTVSEATYYRLYENPDGASGFTQIDVDLTVLEYAYDISVHRLNWLKASYIIEACNVHDCVRATAIGVENAMLDAIGRIRASNSGSPDLFGGAVAISDDGNTLAVGAQHENGTGAVYIFSRARGNWVQQVYLKTYNQGKNDKFGGSVALSSDGNTLAVGATGEDAGARGVFKPDNLPNYFNNSSENSGAVYIFSRISGNWQLQAYVKAFSSRKNHEFGGSVALSGDGNTLAVGATNENFTDGNNAGTVYLYSRVSRNWTQQGGVIASNAERFDKFGYSVALSDDGNTLAVGARFEDSNATGINHPGQNNNDNSASGAVYLFSRVSDNWEQQAYVKASNTGKEDQFGYSVTLSGDGNTLAVGAMLEDSNGTGVNDPTGQNNNNAADSSGAVYLFTRASGNWEQQAYIKASNTGKNNYFGVSVDLSEDGHTLAVGATGERNNDAIGVNDSTGHNNNNATESSGAVYLFSRVSDSWEQLAYVKAPNTGLRYDFGRSVTLSKDGNTLAVGASGAGSVYLY